MLFSKTAISNLLYGSSSMIEIASKDSVIHGALLAINYTDPKVEALRTTWSAAKEATKTHKEAVDDQKEQGLKFKKTRLQANEIYIQRVSKTG